MVDPYIISLLLSTTFALFASALPQFQSTGTAIIQPRNVTSLNQAAFQEAQQRDDTATRAFSSIPIKTSTGKCFFVDELSGDFRANLTPVQIVDCDDTSAGQQWDIITQGKHDDQNGTMLIVSTLTNACLNFDPRRAAGNTVLLFSCGGRADGGGTVTNSQLFNYTNPGSTGPLTLEPLNQAGTCLDVNEATGLLDEADCQTGVAGQVFTFSSAAGNGTTTTSTTTGGSATSTAGASATASGSAGSGSGEEGSCDAE